MFSHVMVGTKNLEKARSFYNEVLGVLGFEGEPIANVSPDGRWVLFTSNWEKTLGIDSQESTSRQDVFIVGLTPQ